MATRWLDPGEGWTIPDYSIITHQLLPDFLWTTFKNASDERQSAAFLVDNTGYNSIREFPDLSGLMSLSRLDTSDSPNPNIERIRNSVLAENTEDTSQSFIPMKTDSFKDGVPEGPGVAPEKITLSEILTDIYGYPSGTLLIDSDSNDGTRNCIQRTSQLKQLYEVMRYQDYYGQVMTLLQPHIDTIEQVITPADVNRQPSTVIIQIDYRYTPTTLTKAEALVQSDSGPIDVYQPGDLNETPPFSSFEDLRTYAIGLKDSYLANGYGVSTVNFGISPDDTEVDLFSRYTEDGSEKRYTLNLRFFSIRFKLKPFPRPTPGQFYEPRVFWNGFYDREGDDFDTGILDRIVEHTELIKQPDGYYYLDVLPTPDYTSPPLAAEVDGSESSNTIKRRVYVPNGGLSSYSLYFKLNNDDGEQFEFHDPPPP